MINEAGECEVLMRLYDACTIDLNTRGNGLNTLWFPVDSTEHDMQAIPEHTFWYRKFNRHKKKCDDCIYIGDKRNLDIVKERMNTKKNEPKTHSIIFFFRGSEDYAQHDITFNEFRSLESKFNEHDAFEGTYSYSFKEKNKENPFHCKINLSQVTNVVFEPLEEE